MNSAKGSRPRRPSAIYWRAGVGAWQSVVTFLATYRRMTRTTTSESSSILGAGPDSNRAVANGLAGKISIGDVIESIGTFSQAVQAHVDFEDETPTGERCAKLDDLAKKFIATFKKALRQQSRRDGKG